MAERFTIIYKFNINKDFIDCPVEINKGAVLFDRLNHKCVLQLKFKNSSKNSVRNLDIQITYFDESENEYNTQASYNERKENDGYFGSDKIVELACDNVKKVDINIIRVVLDDSTVWELQEEKKKELKPQTMIPSILKEQVMRDFDVLVANEFSLFPLDCGEFWQCACGKANEGEFCIKCGQRKNVIFEALDTKNIVSNLKSYIKEEEEKASQNREKKINVINSKKAKIRITCKLISLILVLFFVSWGANRAFDELSFYCAVRLMSNQKYSQAVKKFNKLPQKIYEDRIYEKIENESENILNDFKEEKISRKEACSYFYGLKEYVNAKDIKNIEENLNATKKLNKSRDQFKNGKEYIKKDYYLEAINAFKQVIKDDKNYEEAQKHIKELTENTVKDASIKLEEYKINNNYKDALELINIIDDIIDDDNIDSYYKYFCAVKKGENYLEEGTSFYYQQTLYNSPNKEDDSGYYIVGDGEATVYSYYVDSNYCVWAKVKCEGEYYWLFKD